MPILSYYLEDADLLVTQIRGVLDDETLVEYYGKLCASSKVALHVPELVDLTGISIRSTAGRKGFEEVSRIVKEAYGEAAAQAPSASVAPNLLVFGMMRMYELGYSPDSRAVHTFRDFPSALAWLGREPSLDSLVRSLQVSHAAFLPELAAGSPAAP